MVTGFGLPQDVLKVTNTMGFRSLVFLHFLGLPVGFWQPWMRVEIDMSSGAMPPSMALSKDSMSVEHSVTSVAAVQESLLSANNLFLVLELLSRDSLGASSWPDLQTETSLLMSFMSL
jgi:hypothetical protein